MYEGVETLKRLGMAMRAMRPMSGVQMSSTLHLAGPNCMILLRCPRIEEVWLTPTLEAKIRCFFDSGGLRSKIKAAYSQGFGFGLLQDQWRLAPRKWRSTEPRRNCDTLLVSVRDSGGMGGESNLNNSQSWMLNSPPSTSHASCTLCKFVGQRNGEENIYNLCTIKVPARVLPAPWVHKIALCLLKKDCEVKKLWRSKPTAELNSSMQPIVNSS